MISKELTWPQIQRDSSKISAISWMFTSFINGGSSDSGSSQIIWYFVHNELVLVLEFLEI